jgi:hypothetical protein
MNVITLGLAYRHALDEKAERSPALRGRLPALGVRWHVQRRCPSHQVDSNAGVDGDVFKYRR